MKTDNLINLLTEDTPVRAQLGQMLLRALFLGTAASLIFMAATIGVRGDIGTAMQSVRVLFKIALTLVFTVTACRLVFVIGKPGLPLKARVIALLVPLILLLTGIGIELLVVPADAWKASMMGRYNIFCLFFIPGLSLAPLAGFFWALRGGAPENPGLAGAAAGLAAGGIAAAIYAWHCPDDSPLFVASWYVLAISIVTLIGFVVGRRWLRW